MSIRLHSVKRTFANIRNHELFCFDGNDDDLCVKMDEHSYISISTDNASSIAILVSKAKPEAPVKVIETIFDITVTFKS